MAILTTAMKQWATRPADQRFQTLEEVYAKVLASKQASEEVADVAISEMRALADGDNVMLVGKKNIPAMLTNWSFGQLCQMAEAPAGFLRELSPTLASNVINARMAEKYNGTDKKANVLFEKNGQFGVRGLTSEKYTRIWNADIVERLMRLQQANPIWQPAPKAFDGSRGLYASEQDMFLFLVDNDRRIFETAPGGGLSRGFFVENSEVGAGGFKITVFFYEGICGNHRVLGAQGIREFNYKHIGKADERAFTALGGMLTEYAESSAHQIEAQIGGSKMKEIAATKEEVVDAVYAMKVPGVTKELCEKSYDLAEQRVDWYGNPRSFWGFTGGMTEIARDFPNAGERTKIDRAAGKILQMAF